MIALRSPGLLALALLLGCADDDSGPPWEVGDWRSDDSQFECAHFLNLRENGYAEFKVACVLTNERLGVEINTGTYKLDGGRMLFLWSKSSCSDSGRSESLGVAPHNNDDELTLSTPDGLRTFARFDPSGAGPRGAQAAFGCFNGGPDFTPSPLVDL